MKEAYDVRGRQSNILRLLGFDIEAFSHMLLYRILIFASIIVGGTMLATILFFPQYIGVPYIEAPILVIWILFTIQVYETAKAAVLIFSKGLSSPDLNQSFVNFSIRNKSFAEVYRIFPYAVLLLWIIGFVALLVMWFA